MSDDQVPPPPADGDNDRLPWLETAQDDDEDGPSLGRVLGLALIGLFALGAIIGGIYWLKNRPAPPGNGDLIAAQEGDYKVKPDDPGGLKVDGEGDVAVTTSGGNTMVGNSQIATTRLPEAPVVGTKAKPGAASGKSGSTTSAPVSGPGGTLTAPPPGKPVPVTAGGGGGALAQLGSFPTEAAANSAWGAVAKRFGYLANLGKSIEKADVNGKTYYRLKVNAGSAGAAQELCGKLKVAGQACIVTQ